MSEKLYYRFKMKKDFFENDKIEYMLTNGFSGEKHVIIYIMLILKTLNTNGKLIQVINENTEIPYTLNKIKRDLKYFSEEELEAFFIEAIHIGLIKKENEIYYLTETNELIGKETYYAIEKRKYRSKTKNN